MTSASITYATEKPSIFQLTSGEYQPYTSETLPHYGIDNRIFMAAFMNVGIEVKTEFYQWARALKWTKRAALYIGQNVPIVMLIFIIVT